MCALIILFSGKSSNAYELIQHHNDFHAQQQRLPEEEKKILGWLSYHLITQNESATECCCFCRLWEHLSSHLHLYVQAKEQSQETKNDESPKEVSGRQKSSDVLPRSNGQTHSEHTIESNTATRRRNKREWKGIGQEGSENFPLRSVLTDILHGEEKRSQKSSEIRHPPSRQQNGRKRERDDEPQQTKV